MNWFPSALYLDGCSKYGKFSRKKNRISGCNILYFTDESHCARCWINISIFETNVTKRYYSAFICHIWWNDVRSTCFISFENLIFTENRLICFRSLFWLSKYWDWTKQVFCDYFVVVRFSFEPKSKKKKRKHFRNS